MVLRENGSAARGGTLDLEIAQLNLQVARLLQGPPRRFRIAERDVADLVLRDADEP